MAAIICNCCSFLLCAPMHRRLGTALPGATIVQYDGSSNPTAGEAAAQALGMATHLVLTAQPTDDGDPALRNPTIRAKLVELAAAAAEPQPGPSADAVRSSGAD